jgi:hypothetical protein
MMGYWGYRRPLAEFTQRYGREIYRRLELAEETPLPSYSTLGRVMQQLDDQVFAALYTQWVQADHPVESGEWFSADGKSIKSSVSDYDQAEQNFVTLVTLFSHQHGGVQAVMPMENKRVSEQAVVRM